MTYTGELMDVMGQWNVTAQYGLQSKTLLFIVVTGVGLSLLGRNWLKHLNHDWKKIGKITAVQAIELEFIHLEGAGVLTEVIYSDWAALIVAVPKKDGRIRTCGNCKVTVNHEVEMDQYPLR